VLFGGVLDQRSDLALLNVSLIPVDLQTNKMKRLSVSIAGLPIVEFFVMVCQLASWRRCN
jgi:hypothetical protein